MWDSQWDWPQNSSVLTIDCVVYTLHDRLMLNVCSIIETRFFWKNPISSLYYHSLVRKTVLSILRKNVEKTVRHHCTSTYANCHYFEKLFNVAATRISHRRQSRVFVLRTLGCAASAWRPSCQGYIDSFFRIAQTESCETTDGWLSLIFGRFMIIMNIKRKGKKSMVWKRRKNLGSAHWNWILKRRLFKQRFADSFYAVHGSFDHCWYLLHCT